MTTFESAEARLDNALARLEAAVRQRISRPAESNPGMAEEIAALRKECGELRARLSGADAQNGAMRQTVSDVSGEIGETIAELDVLLEK